MRPASSTTSCLLLVPAVLCFSLPLVWAQAPPKKPATAKPPAPAPAAPQSRHYPILIIAHGNEPSWSLRLGMKGPERLDRAGYPPIVLEPSDVAREGTADAWTYRAKDTATGADVAVHLTRESCSDTLSETSTPSQSPIEKFTFRAVVEHAQLASLQGCARSAPNLFPEFRQKNQDQDDQDKDKDSDPNKKKSVLDPITNFKLPVAVAFLNTAQQLVFKRGQVARVVSTRPSSGLSVSHDGKKLLFTADDAPGPIRTLYQYDFDTSAKHELIRANVRQPFWSPDDKRIAFLKWADSVWSLWTMPSDNPQAASGFFTVGGMELYGWADEHTLLGSDSDSLLWISDDGSIRQKLSFQEIIGSAYHLARIDSFRLNPANTDILLVSFWHVPTAPELPLDKHEGNSPALLLYEIKSKRRVVLTPVGTWAESAEWSRDGLQIFFAGSDSSRRYSTYRMFWDGSDLRKYADGSNLVIGQ